MLTGFSRQQNNRTAQEKGRGAAAYLALTEYMDGPTVMKEIDGAKAEVLRTPAPEILLGRADVLRRSVAALPFQQKYRFALMSCAQSDINVEAFNLGDAVTRRQVDLALDLFMLTLWPGIPVSARPPIYVTTHTHTGRLEVNLALPRAVFVGDLPYSYNPDPPTPLGEPPALWRAMRDVMNTRFAWADPEDPLRRRDLARPDWQIKLEAEARRAGLQPEIDTREDLMNQILAEVDAGHVASREEVMTCLQSLIRQHGWSILGQTRNSVTVGDPAAPIKERLRLRGRVFDVGFSGMPWLKDPEFLAAQTAARAAELAAAPQRFMTAWNSRAAFNVARYGKGSWQASGWDVSHWLAEALEALPRLIPSRHHTITRSLKANRLDVNHDTSNTLRAPVSGPDGPDRSGSHGPLDGPAGADRGIGERQPGKQTGDGAVPAEVARLGDLDAASIKRIGLLEQHARQISGPAGIGAVLARIAGALTTFSTLLGQYLAQAAVTKHIAVELAGRFATTGNWLEKLNDDWARHRDGIAGSEADTRPSAPFAMEAHGPAAERWEREGREDRRARPESDAYRAGLGSYGEKAGAGSGNLDRSVDGRRASGRGDGGDGQAYQPNHGSNGALGNLDGRPHLRTARTTLTTRPSLVEVLRVCRRVLRALDPDRTGSLGRIKGGFHLRAPGVSLEIRGNSVDIRRWDLSQKRLSATLEFIARLLDVAAISPSLVGHSSLPDDQVARPPEAQPSRSFVHKKSVGDPDAFAAVLPEDDAEGSMPGADDEGPHVS